MSSPNTITMVEPAARRNVVLPNEILYKIFALVVVGSSARSKAIDLKYYSLISRVGMVGKLMRVNHQFAAVAVAVFYEQNGFNFFNYEYYNNPQTYSTLNDFGTQLPPALPPLWTHKYLRQIRIVVHLSDTWWKNGMGAGRIITSSEDLVRYCPGARILQLLTMSITNLHKLDLHVEELFEGPDFQASCAVYRSAGFRVHAKEVKLLITNIRGVPGKYSHLWYPALAKAIGL